MKIKLILIFLLSLFPFNYIYADNLMFPEIPYSEDSDTAANMISDARVEDFEPKTDGYKVTDPDGQTYYVDDISDPTYAFYGTYIDFDDNILIAPDVIVNSEINIERLCFDGCY